jgi:hypothetical protein
MLLKGKGPKGKEQWAPAVKQMVLHDEREEAPNEVERREAAQDRFQFARRPAARFGRTRRGGHRPRELKAILRGLSTLHLVGLDIVEVSPPFDTNAELRGPSTDRRRQCRDSSLRSAGFSIMSAAQAG